MNSPASELYRLASVLDPEVGDELRRIAVSLVAYQMQFKRRKKNQNTQDRIKQRSYRRKHKRTIMRRQKLWRRKNRVQLKRRRTRRHIKPTGYKPGPK